MHWHPNPELRAGIDPLDIQCILEREAIQWQDSDEQCRQRYIAEPTTRSQRSNFAGTMTPDFVQIPVGDIGLRALVPPRDSEAFA